MECTCRVGHPYFDDGRIHYCPLHAAAPEMLAALKGITAPGRLASGDAVIEYVWSISELIAKASGEVDKP